MSKSKINLLVLTGIENIEKSNSKKGRRKIPATSYS